MGYTIYLIGKKPDLNRILTTYLQAYGWAVKTFQDYANALQHVADGPDLWITDMPPSPPETADSLVRKLKSHNNAIPVIFVFDLKVTLERLFELNTECDDYVVKPFSPLELIMRTQKLLQRHKTEKAPDRPKSIQAGEYEIHILERQVTRQGKSITLTTKEFDLLYLLAANPRRTFSKEQLIQGIWADHYCVSDRAIYDLISRVRAKLKALKIKTIYGYGYRIQ